MGLGTLDEIRRLREENARLRLACSTSAADLQAIGKLCGMRDDEYPLKAVERLTRERAEAAEAKLAETRCARGGEGGVRWPPPDSVPRVCETGV